MLAEAIGLLVGEPGWSWQEVETHAAANAPLGGGQGSDAWLSASVQARGMHVLFIAHGLMVRNDRCQHWQMAHVLASAIIDILAPAVTCPCCSIFVYPWPAPEITWRSICVSVSRKAAWQQGALAKTPDWRCDHYSCAFACRRLDRECRILPAGWQRC